MPIRSRWPALNAWLQKLAVLGSAAGSVIASMPVEAAELPAPCVAGTCGPTGPSQWISSGNASASVSGNTMRIDQTTDRAVLNWSSFNIGPDGQVIFNQPGVSSIALNKIFQASPSQIFGMLQSNGQVYLVNQNGFLFGSTARVNVGGLLAATLNLTDADNNLLAPIRTNQAALASDGRAGVVGADGQVVIGPDGKPVPVKIVVQSGASIASNTAGQRVMLAAQNIDNSGTVQAKDGQVILAAGSKAYLQASTDPQLRGLLVEVDGGGVVDNQITADVSSDHGNVTLVGLAVNQLGRVSATTSVSENGSIRLLARDTAVVTPGQPLKAGRGGKLTLGANSSTTVMLDLTDTSTAVDEQKQLQSTLQLQGQQVVLKGGSRIVAPGGLLTVTAATDPSAANTTAASDPNAHIRVDAGATIDLSGSTATASVTRNLVAVQLRANELANSPQQRDGALRGQTVVVDARVGTPVADVTGAIGLIQRDILERTETGGSAVFDSAGDVVVASGARVDVSGGKLNYTGGLMQTTQLIKSDGSLVDIGTASPDATYSGIVNPTFKSVSDTWGVIRLIPTPGIAHYDPGYTQGADAGSVQFLGSSMVLNGDFVGNVVNGQQQRSGSNIARSGRFIVGDPSAVGTANPDFRAPSVQFSVSTPTLGIDDDANLPGGLPLVLPVRAIQAGGFGHIQIISNDRIAVPDDVGIALGAGSSISLIAPTVNVQGRISAPAGSIQIAAANSVTSAANPTFRAPGIFVDDGAVLDVDGMWVNDFALPQTTLATGLALADAGSISLSQQVIGGALSIGSDVALHASGGGWAQRSGTIVGGKGGSVSLSSGPLGTFSVGDGFTVDGFGVQSARGGSFSLTAPRIDIGTSGPQWLAAQTITEGPDSGALEVGASLFSTLGFSSFALTANGVQGTGGSQGILNVQANTLIDLRTPTRVFTSDALARASGQNVGSFSTLQLLPDYVRSASSLSLNALPGLVHDLGPLGGVSVSRGAQILADSGSTVNFKSSGGIDFDGVIRAPSGSVSLTTVLPTELSDDVGFLQDLAVKLGNDALIDVSGTTIYQPDDRGRLKGQVTAGGSVSLTALRGSVLTSSGSTIKFNGTASPLDVQAADGHINRTTIATSAGSLSVQAAEAISLLGHLQGQGGDAHSAGGSLTVSLTRLQSEITRSPEIQATFPTLARTLLIAPDDSNVIPSASNGIGVLGVNHLAGSGIDSLTLSSDDTIRFADGVNLSLARSFTAQAPALGVDADATASVFAPYVSLGAGTTGLSAATAQAGTGNLSIGGDFLSVTGVLSFQGVAHATLASSGELQLRGNEQDDTNGGSIAIAGDLTLRAARVVPSTATNFSITANGGTTNTVRIEQSGSLPDVPLSVGGSLSIHADDIVQAGTLLAPFGKISLDAVNSLELAGGSLTSVSGAGATLPYGRVDNGTDWVYEVRGPLHPLPVDGTPERQVSLSAPDVTLASGATVDVSGGGDLLSYQWIPGTGGTRDALAGGATPGLYAVVPTVGGQAAPYDPMMWAQSGLTPGQSIYWGGGGGLGAGTYALLPARYALLPGAYLVQAVSGFQDLQPGTSARATDGSQVVAAHLTFGNTGLGDTRFSGYTIRPGSYGRLLSDYEDNLGSRFFSPTGPQPSTAANALPRDGGTLTVAVQNSLSALGSIRAKAGEGGENGTVEISAPNIEIDASVPAGAVPSGTVHLGAATLNAWNPGRLVLGATHTADGLLDVTADSVRVGSGAHLSFDEIVLAANQEVSLDAGASVTSTAFNSGAALPAQRFEKATSIALTPAAAAGAAVVAVSDLGYLVPDRSNAGAADTQASVVVASGAVVGSRGSLALDSPGSLQIGDGTVSGQGARWSLGAGRIAFGGGDSAPDGLAINSAVLDALDNAKSVRLASRTSLDLFEPVSLGGPGGALSEIDLLASSIVNQVPGSTSTFAANRVVLGGNGTASSTPQQGAGSLQILAQEIDIDVGNLALSGFDHTMLQATGALVGRGTGSLLGSGDLTISTPVLTAQSGADTQIGVPNGTLTLAALNGAPATTAPDLQAGGALAFTGQSIIASTAIRTPSGKISLAATNDLTLAAGATLSAAGISPVNATHGSNGGRIDLSAGGVLTAASGTSLDVSAGKGADAGNVSAFGGGSVSLGAARLLAASDAGQRGGSFSAQAAALIDFAALNRQLESGGFSAERDFRVATGSLDVTADMQINARIVKLIADGGSINVEGTIDASASGERGTVVIDARDGLTVAGSARILANALDADTRGGSIELATTVGSIAIASDATLAASGRDSSGSLTIRAPALEDSNDIRVDSLANDLSHVDNVNIMPVFARTVTDLPTSSDFDGIAADVGAHMNAAAGNIADRLGVSGKSNVVVRPFIDVTTPGDLLLPSLELSAWRFGGLPADLSIRAGGNITVNGTVSDGFRTLTRPNATSYLDLIGGRSSGISLVAGADLQSASAVAVARGSSADLTIAAGSIVRTGTGDLRLASSGNVTFEAGAAVYTGGNAGSTTTTRQVRINGRNTTLASTFPNKGGSIFIDAGADVVGTVGATAGPVSVGDWERRGASAGTTATWGIDFDRFNWNVGALGGGDVRIAAAGNVRDLSAAAGDSSSLDGNKNSLSFGGGNLTLASGGDIGSSLLYVAHGSGRIDAGGALTGTQTDVSTGNAVATLLLAGDASYSVAARGDVLLAGEVAASALPAYSAATGLPDLGGFFYRYSPTSSLGISSAGGNVTISNETSPSLIGLAAGQPDPMTVLPASLDVASFGGDLNIGNNLVMIPSDRGNLSLYAARDINDHGVITMADTVDALIPSTTSQGTGFDLPFDASRNAYSQSTRHTGDLVPVSIVAGRDINSLGVNLPKAATLLAGRDIVDLSLHVQNLAPTDVTLVHAGRDIRYSPANQGSSFDVGGPGQFELIADRNVNLGFSAGITSNGNVLNSNLPAQGADISVVAGLGAPVGVTPATAASNDDFLNKIVSADAGYEKQLVAYVQSQTGKTGLTYEQAATEFRSFDPSKQLPLLESVFFAELVKSGRETTADPTSDFKRGYAAIDSLFPGSRPGEAGPASPYQGDLNLPFSRIYTLAGGSISLLVPGGLVNVGLTNPPPSLAQLGFTRAPSELGIVSVQQGDVHIFSRNDVLVNTSRVFTLGGGNIAIWSTEGNIDAGRGAKTAISQPPPTIDVDDTGTVRINFSSAVAGSGIRTILTGTATQGGDIDLIAPAGFVNAGDAGIGSAGNLNVAAQRVLGLDNIQVGGTSTGVPPETSGLGASLTAASSTASSATSASGAAISESAANSRSSAPMADSALGWLDVFVEGFGEEVCKPSDTECLKRQHK